MASMIKSDQLRLEAQSVVRMCDSLDTADVAEYLDLIAHSLRLCVVLCEEMAAASPVETRCRDARQQA